VLNAAEKYLSTDIAQLSVVWLNYNQDTTEWEEISDLLRNRQEERRKHQQVPPAIHKVDEKQDIEKGTKEVGNFGFRKPKE
jgi:ABC-type bacteriocin/lantibiotic exporter with double-glycine peptidase domain